MRNGKPLVVLLHRATAAGKGRSWLAAYTLGYPVSGLPAPTRDPAQMLRDIERQGLAIVPEVLTGDTLARTRDAIYRAAESDRARGREQRLSLDYAGDTSNQRVANVLSRDPLF